METGSVRDHGCTMNLLYWHSKPKLSVCLFVCCLFVWRARNSLDPVTCVRLQKYLFCYFRSMQCLNRKNRGRIWCGRWWIKRKLSLCVNENGEWYLWKIGEHRFFFIYPLRGIPCDSGTSRIGRKSIFAPPLLEKEKKYWFMDRIASYREIKEKRPTAAKKPWEIDKQICTIKRFTKDGL